MPPSTIQRAPPQNALALFEGAESFQSYLNQYAHELPRLTPGSFTEKARGSPDLNCHCYAIGMESGYESPAERLMTGLSRTECLQRITAWFQDRGFIPIDAADQQELTRRDKRNEKVLVYGITGTQARELLRDRSSQISEDLKSTLAVAFSHGDDALYPTHSIVQSFDGDWESKMGSGPVIKIDSPALLSAGVYGAPVLAFQRRRTRFG